MDREQKLYCVTLINFEKSHLITVAELLDADSAGYFVWEFSIGDDGKCIMEIYFLVSDITLRTLRIWLIKNLKENHDFSYVFPKYVSELKDKIIDLHEKFNKTFYTYESGIFTFYNPYAQSMPSKNLVSILSATFDTFCWDESMHAIKQSTLEVRKLIEHVIVKCPSINGEYRITNEDLLKRTGDQRSVMAILNCLLDIKNYLACAHLGQVNKPNDANLVQPREKIRKLRYFTEDTFFMYFKKQRDPNSGDFDGIDLQINGELCREVDIQKLVELDLNGRHKSIPNGQIDVLSKSKICEIKRWSDWRHGSGQVIQYGSSYVNHTKQMHFFGPYPQDLMYIMDIYLSLKRVDIAMSFEGWAWKDEEDARICQENQARSQCKCTRQSGDLWTVKLAQTPNDNN